MKGGSFHNIAVFILEFFLYTPNNSTFPAHALPSLSLPLCLAKLTMFACEYKGLSILIPYSGKFLRVQTFAKMPPEAPEEIFAVLIFATKPCIVQYQLGC